MRAMPLLASVPLAVCAPDACASEHYPSRPVRVIVPAAPGTGPDLLARPVAGRMADALKLSVVVENRPGASGAAVVHHVDGRQADGHTLLLGETTQLVGLAAPAAPAAHDAARDLVPVAKLAELPHALFVHPSLPVNTLRELVALARARYGAITYAGAEPGSFTDAVAEALNASAGIRMVRVPPATPTMQAVDGMLSGHAMVGFGALHPRLQQLRRKRLRAMAVGSLRRVDAVPSVPTFAEAGLGEFRASQWFGLFAPAGTPSAVVAKLEAAAHAAIDSREVRHLLQRAGLEPGRMPRERFGHLVRDDIARFERIARDASAGRP
jgi:tripartite-type tricarboxylate transporter receptor subunit TctC